MSLRICSTNNTYFTFVQEQKTPAIVLAALVFAAGAATAGVALAGFIPFNYLYVGMGLIAIDLAVSGVLLAALFCHHKKGNATDEQEADPIDSENSEEQIHSTEKDAVSEEKSVAEKEQVSEKERSQQIGKATGKLDPCWLPDEVLVEIFSYLNPNDVGQALFVSKHWNRLAKNKQLWADRIQALGWREDQPNCFEAWRSLHAIKNTCTPKCFAFNLPIGSKFASHGNQLAIYSMDTDELELWEIKQNKLNRKTSTSLQNITVEDLSIRGEKVHVYNAVGDKMDRMLQWDVLTNTKNDIDLDLPWHVRGSPIYENNYIWAEEFYEYSKEIIIIAADVISTKREMLTRLNLPKIKTPATSSIPVQTASVVSDGILLIQCFCGEEPKKGFPIWRLDLETKKWLPELKPGYSFRLVSAVAGLVITQNKTKTNVWDYRMISK